jgi:hypothetical protein
MLRWALPSCSHREPQAVQKARRCGLTTMTILTDWQTGQRDIAAPFAFGLPGEQPRPKRRVDTQQL